MTAGISIPSHFGFGLSGWLWPKVRGGWLTCIGNTAELDCLKVVAVVCSLPQLAKLANAS
jgi:hypothetical protein